MPSPTLPSPVTAPRSARAPRARRLLLAALAAGAAGCVQLEESYFLERMPEAICLKYDECGYLEQWRLDPETCMLSQAIDACGDNFDKRVAADCLDDIADIICDDLERRIEDLVPACFETCPE